MRVEVIIIGAGIAGISTAYSLQKRGVRNVLVVDRGGVNGGSTNLAAGIVSHLFTDELELEIIKLSVRTFKEIEKESMGHFSYHQSGMVSVGGKRHEPRLLRALQAMGKNDIASTLLDSQGLSELVPDMIGDDLKLAVHCTESGYLDQALFTGVTSDLLESRGASILEGVDVYDVTIGTNREVTGIETNRGPITSNKVVIAGGVWSKFLGEKAGLALPIHVLKAQSMTLLLEESLRIPVFFDLTSEVYMRPLSQNAVLAGNGSKPYRRNIDNYSSDAESLFMEELKLRLSSRFKQFKNSKIDNAWSGLYSSTPDGRPLVGESDQVRGLFYLCAFQGLGIMFSPGCAELLSDLIVGRRTKEISSMRAERFVNRPDLRSNRSKHWSSKK